MSTTSRCLGAALVTPPLLLLLLAPELPAQDGQTEKRRVRRLADPDAFAAHLERQTGVTLVPGATLPPGGVPRLDGTRPKILLTGYWPPSNEGVRFFSTDPLRNPGGWIGDDWESLGYDIHSYFPEFTPRNCSFCGKGSGDLEVDYQDTSVDFWRILDEIRPIAIITFSRGWDDQSWELELNQYNRKTWVGDYLAPFQPTPAPPDDSLPAEALRLTTLPVQAIIDAVASSGLGLDTYINHSGNGGGFLSEFIAYHGVWAQDLYRSPADPDWCIAGGHVHVGGRISWATTHEAVKITLRELIAYVDSVRASVICQQDLGFGGPGVGVAQMCGGDLHTGTTADLMASGLPPSTVAFLLAGFAYQPTPFAGGTLIPMPPVLFESYVADERGRVLLEDLDGGCGPSTIFAQFAWLDPAQPGGFGISNALQIAMND
jgi:hypothetical protein